MLKTMSIFLIVGILTGGCWCDEPIQKPGDQYRQAFGILDTNGDGRITKQELNTLLETFGGINPEEAQLQQMIDQVDTDGNDYIDYTEFQITVEKKVAETDAEEEKFRETFKIADKDGNGFVNAIELRQAFKDFGNKYTNEEVDEMFGKYDTDGDGQLNYEEFVRELPPKSKREERPLHIYFRNFMNVL